MLLSSMAPPSTPKVAVPGSGGSAQLQENLSNLRQLRAEMQDLQGLLQSIGRGETTPKDHVGYITRTTDDIRALMALVREVDFPGGKDQIRHVHNIWEQMEDSPLLLDPAADFDPQDQLHHMNRLGALIRDLVYQVGYLTIPDRLQGWLEGQWPGHYVPFYPVFEDELPPLEDREKLLSFMAWKPKLLPEGLVDLSNGIVYKYDAHRWKKWLYPLGVMVALAASVGIVVGACYLPVDTWLFKKKDVATLLIAWGAVLAGVVVHGAVATTKRAQTTGRPPVIAPSQLLPNVSAKFGQILLKLLMVLIGLFGFAFAVGNVTELTPMNSFLVGYSLDSVVELFGNSIEKQSAAQISRLKTDLGLTGEG